MSQSDQPEVIAIRDRVASRRSGPLLVDASDGQTYYLKGALTEKAGKALSLAARRREWAAATLAEEFGLPVAPFSVLHLSEILAEHSGIAIGATLEPGFYFASQRIPFARSIFATDLTNITPDLQFRILCFDWWVANSSRDLDPIGGEADLLWNPSLESLSVIDYADAFDTSFDGASFRHRHPFRDIIPVYPQKKRKAKRLRTSFEAAIYRLKEDWGQLPDGFTSDLNQKSRSKKKVTKGGHVIQSREDMESFLMKPQWDPFGMLNTL